MKEKLSVGFYFTIVAAVLSLVGVVMYGNVMYKLTSVYVFLAAAVIVEVIAFILAKVKQPVYEVLPLVNAVLTACAAVWAVSLMVNQIGYVIAELDTIDTIIGLFYFEGVVVAAMLLNIIAAFMPLKKQV